MAVAGKNASGKKPNDLLAAMCRHRSEAARLFPHCGESGLEFVQQYQGCKLSAESVEALKRG